MKSINELYKKITELNNSVKNDLKKNGFIVPILLNDNKIKIGNFIINKNTKGFFEIKDRKNKVFIENINLAQTAILIANKLALGKWANDDLLKLDKNYGYLLFDEQVYLRSKQQGIKNKNFDKVDIMNHRLDKLKTKKEYLKNSILINYQKLLNFR